MGWKEKNISKARREVLIKMVAQAILTYSMSMFKISNKICDNINSALAKYWWGQTWNEKIIHWIRWSKLCNPNDRGGMGFRDIHAFNLAMLKKQAWWLIQGSHSLFFRVYKVCYFPNCSFMEVEIGNNPSFVWSRLLETRDLIRAATVWKVGDGKSIKIDDHRWLPHPPQFRPEAENNMRVCDLFNPDTGQWHQQLLIHTFMPHTMAEI